MREKKLVILLTACAGVVLAACAANDRAGVNNNSGAAPQTASNGNRNVSAQATTTTPAATPADGVRRITVADLQSALEKGEAMIVDVRSEDSYAAGHIKGARVIPEDQIARRADELPRDKLIVTYCA
jgi:hypothetical protein